MYLLLTFAALASAGSAAPALPEFTLTERSGARVTRDDLLGEAWIVSFVLTRCPDGRCPQVARTVQRLQGEMVGRRGLRFVTFTVDPSRDDPSELTRYAEAHGADPHRWLFLTGSEEEVEKILKALYLPVGKGKEGARLHTQKLFLLGRDGRVVTMEDGLWERDLVEERDFERGLLRLKRAADEAIKPSLPGWMPSDFPAFNALLNAIATVLLLVGYWAIRLRAVRVHVACMLSAVAVSALFLASYLFYHIYIKAGRETRFHEQAPDAPTWMAWAYYGILISHVLLSIVSTPMVLYTAWLGVRQRWERHVAAARWTFPMWVYVSTTGVVVYWMLYRMYPPP